MSESILFFFSFAVVFDLIVMIGIVVASVNKIRFKNLIFYGPHSCAYCGQRICRSSKAQGYKTFDYPIGPIYPNTIWNSHDCEMDQSNHKPKSRMPLDNTVVGVGSSVPLAEAGIVSMIGEEQATRFGIR